MQNSNCYLKVFILWIDPFNSLLLRVDARLTTSLRGSIDFILDVYVPLLVDPSLESRKHMHVVSLYFVYDFQLILECIAKEIKSKNLPSG